MYSKKQSAICQIFNGSCYSRSGPDELWKRCKWAGKMGLKNYVLSLFTFKCRLCSTWRGGKEKVARKLSWLCFSMKPKISIMYGLSRNFLSVTNNHLQLVTSAEAGTERMVSEPCLGPGSSTKGKPQSNVPLQLYWGTLWQIRLAHEKHSPVNSQCVAPIPFPFKAVLFRACTPG